MSRIPALDICESQGAGRSQQILSRKDNLMAHKRNVHGQVFESGTHESLSKDATVEHHETEEGSPLLDEQLTH